MIFPHATEQDSALYSMEQEDPSINSDTEGGYSISRPRHTRRPRRIFGTGLSYISDAKKKDFEDFYSDVHGGSLIFSWEHPVDNVMINVRFKGSISYKYQGVGETKLWQCTMKLEEA